MRAGAIEGRSAGAVSPRPKQIAVSSARRYRRVHPEHRRPAAQRDGLPADQRRDHRDHAEYRHHARQQVRRLLARVQVAHDGAGDHRAARHAESLEEAQLDQRRQGARCGAAHARNEKKCHARQQHRLAAIAVGHRTPRKLADSQPEQVGGDGQLGGARLGGCDSPAVLPAVLPNARAITGTDGRNMSMPSAVSAIRTPRSSVKGSEA